jgi:hypothetical protein
MSVVIVWTYDQTTATPVRRFAETFGYPHRCWERIEDMTRQHGEQQYANHHFLTEEEAWESLRLDREAGAFLNERSLEAAEKELRKVQAAALEAFRAERAYRAARAAHIENLCNVQALVRFEANDPARSMIDGRCRECHAAIQIPTEGEFAWQLPPHRRQPDPDLGGDDLDRYRHPRIW